MNRTNNLKVNSRWKFDTKENKSSDKKKRNRDYVKRSSKMDMINREDRKEVITNNFDLFNTELFPELVVADKIGDGKNDYLEKIKKQKEIDEVKIKLKPGWVAYKREKNKNEIKVSRDGINYYNSLYETYTIEEIEKNEKEEFDRDMELMSQRLEALYLKRKKESSDYYYETGNLDSFALAEIDRIEYDKYVEKFDKEYMELQEISDDEYSDEDGYDSDNKYKYR
jgi:hypothetical protein